MASIKFENIEYKDATTGLGLDNKVGVGTNGADYDQFRGEEVDTIFPSVNAIEIDWNGATPGIGENTLNGIKTTSELLNLLKSIYTSVQDTNKQMVQLNNSLATLGQYIS